MKIVTIKNSQKKVYYSTSEPRLRDIMPSSKAECVSVWGGIPKIRKEKNRAL